MEGKPEAEPFYTGENAVAESIREKLRADHHALRAAINECRGCAGGGKGIPGEGEPGSDLFLLAGMPGPGAGPDNPWGSWRDRLLAKTREEWGWDMHETYFSTALRCRLPMVTRREVRRCAAFLAEELFIVGPRLVVVSGKVAAVALHEALGGAMPEKPRAGDSCSLFSTTFLFELDVARIEKEEDVARTFWHILRQAEDLGSRRQD